MAYGQENYNDKVGNGTFTLRQIGCFVTAFSNLLSRFGTDQNPSQLNKFFTDHNVYLPDPYDGVGVKDDLAWGSVTAFDPTITVSAIGSGSWPNSDNAIVKFVYKEGGSEVTHFCLVDSVTKKTIIDSWDGLVKEPGKYGAPVAWAAYVDKDPQPVPVPHPASGGSTPPPASYTVVRDLPGFIDSNHAANHVDQVNTVHAKTYVIFNQANGMINVTETQGVPGTWINPADNVPSAAPDPQPASANNPETLFLPAAAGNWRVYPLGGPWVPGHEVGKLWPGNPAWAPGLTYQILAQIAPNIYKIHTQTYGDVAIYAGSDTIAQFPGHGEGEPNSEPDLSWQETFTQFGRGMYVSKATMTVYDLSKTEPGDGNELLSGTRVSIAGTFTKGSVLYGRPTFAVRAGTWEGIPVSDLQGTVDALPTPAPAQAPLVTLTERLPKAPKKTMYDHVVIAVASVVGLLRRHSMKKAGKR